MLLYDDQDGWNRGQAQEGGDMCIIMADLCCYVAETNKTL